MAPAQNARQPMSLWQVARAAIEGTGGIDLMVPPRTPPRDMPDFAD
jgi:hypothetical protein